MIRPGHWTCRSVRRAAIIAALLLTVACSSTGRNLSRAERVAAQALCDKAKAHATAHELYSALTNANSCLKIDPDNADSHEIYQDVLLQLEASGDQRKGTLEETYRQYQDDEPDDPMYIYLYGRALYLLGDRTAAFDYYTQALTLDPNEQCSNIRSAIAVYYREEKKDAPKADEFSRRATLVAARNKAFYEASDDVLNVAKQIAYQDLAFSGGGLKELDAHYFRLVEENPDEPELVYLYGRVAAMAGQLDQAEPYFDHALVVRPGYPWALDAKGTLILKRLEEAKFADPDKRQVITERAIENARKYFEQALQSDANFLSSRIKLAKLMLLEAMLFRNDAKLTAAAEWLKESTLVAPDSAELRHLTGEMYRLVGAWFLATEQFQRAIELASLSEDGVRNNATQALGMIKEAKRLPDPQQFGVEEYLLRIESDDPQVRKAALLALAGLRDRKATQAITKCLEDPEDTVRKTAIDVMDDWGMYFDEAAMVLGGMLRNDSSFTVRGRAAAMLGHFQQKWIIYYLIQGLADLDPYVREMSIKSLRTVTDKNFGFNHNGTDTERADTVLKWNAWWAQNKDALSAQDKVRDPIDLK